MDPYTEKLMERTRQRRELLNQKLGKTPDAAPRKRVLEERINIQQTPVDDDSPKRQRVWESGGGSVIKPDTPAIKGVQSRLHALSDERSYWSDTANADNERPPVSRQEPSNDPQTSPAAPANRRGRFANLAKHINDWEDDLSHPTIHKVEEKKPRWQPPKPQKESERVQQTVVDVTTKHVSSPKKEYELYQGPKRFNNQGPPSSPKANRAPVPPPAPPVPPTSDGPPKPPRSESPERCSSPKKFHAPGVPTGSPKVSTHTVQLQDPAGTPKYQHQVKQVVDQVPVNQCVSEDTDDDEMEVNDPSEQPATWRCAPAADSNKEDSAQLPMAARMSGWEHRISQTPKSEQPSRPAQTPKPFGTPAISGKTQSVCLSESSETPYHTADSDPVDSDPASRPVSDRMARWQQHDAQAAPSSEDEPTAYSVTDRMSAWETMSSANKVSYIKKVNPGSPKHSPHHSPVRPVNFKPTGTPNKVAPFKPQNTPTKGLTPQKSFKESLEERATQMGRRPVTTEAALPPKPPTNQSRSPAKTKSPARTGPRSPVRVGSATKSPARTGPRSPVRVGSATKSLQQKLIEQTQHSKTDQFAERLRNERMAEVNALKNRFPNGIPKTDDELSDTEVECTVSAVPPPPAPGQTSLQKRETIRARARAEFNNKLEQMGFDDGGAYSFQNNNGQQGEPIRNGDNDRLASQGVCKPPPAPLPPNMRGQDNHKSAPGVKKASSIYRLVSKKCSQEERPVIRQQQSTTSLKKVTFEDHDTSTESEQSTDYTASTETADETDITEDFDPPSENGLSETQESFDDSFDSATDSSIPESYRGPAQSYRPHPSQSHTDEDDDVSISAFVPQSVRRESVMPAGHHDSSNTSEDSVDCARTGGHSRANLQGYRQEDSEVVYRRKQPATTSDSEDDEEGEAIGAIDDLLDEAMDDVSEVEMRHKREPVAAPRKRQSHMYATTAGELNLPATHKMGVGADGLAYTVSMYRSRNTDSPHTTIQTTVNFDINDEVPAPNLRISRHSRYIHEGVQEEDIQMPTELPLDVQRKSVHERIKELLELVSQEQSVIMQTSNALNQCCSGDSQFAGSAEQVECHRLLLISCQKRQAYLTEVQRLKETGRIDPLGHDGPKGSLTISDIRLPLKKDFVTKIGTATDNTVHYFVILIRNGPQIIQTQMLSTHDPMMRGSLDFPNLIKVHGISGRFNLTLEIFSMSVSRECIKDKKKKTPKKKTLSIAMESPGGPMAVRSTCFTLITTLPLSMKCLDKNSFSLERISYLSPLHGMIYMRLKCMMEQNVEERGFLTMFEDVSGLGAWHRRWCVLTGNKLAYWKYPDEEMKKDPMGYVDLKRCITEKAVLIPRDLCARPHTFDLTFVRPPRKGEQDTLISKTYSTMTTTRYMLSADTKEERIVWCNKVNRALANIRTWHSDAMRPIRPHKK